MTKITFQEIKLENSTLKNKYELLKMIPKSYIYGEKKTCQICLDQKVEEQFKNKTNCIHTKHICSDCLKNVFLDTAKCPFCNNNWYEEHNNLPDYYATKIQRFIKSNIKTKRKRKLSDIEEEKVCYRCAKLINGILVPSYTHNHFNCSTTCGICKEPGDTVNNTKNCFRHCTNLCPFKEKDEEMKKAIRNVPKEYRSQLIFY